MDFEAEWILESAGFDREDAPGGLRLARHLGFGISWVSSSLLHHAHAAILPVRKEFVIGVRYGLDPKRVQFAICHELAEFHLKRIGYQEEDTENVANRLAAALLIPRKAFRQALEEHGQTWEQLAFDFETTQTCVVLRYGEVTDEPLAVVDSDTIRVRGELREWLMSASRLRELARISHPGIRSVRITDERNRLAIFEAS